MSSSVTTKALQSGCAVLSHTPGFFSTAAVSWPVTGAGLVCRALAIAESSVLSEFEGPTPDQSKWSVEKTNLFKKYGFDTNRVVDLVGYPPCKPLGRSIDFISSSAISNAFNPLSFRSQNSCRSKQTNKNFLKTEKNMLLLSVLPVWVGPQLSAGPSSPCCWDDLLPW